MARSRSSGSSKKTGETSSLVIRLDEDSKSALVRAAELRRISVSEYVGAVTVAQARKEIQAAREHILAMTPEEQLEFWSALDRTGPLTGPQKQLVGLMRGES
jgi:uncharacterized protein (DUF1778 family)